MSPIITPFPVRLGRLVSKIRALFNLNDPKWGQNNGQSPSSDQNSKQNPDAPPDLDQMWRDFNQRLNQLFGGKRGNNGGSDKPNGSPGHSTGARLGIGVFLAVGAGLWMLTGFFIVQEGQAGVVLEFGKYKYTARAGINWHLPVPIQSHELVNVSAVRSVEVGRSNLIKATNLKDSSMLTEDENIIDVKFAVQYRLKDAADFVFNDRNPEASVIQAAETAVREIVGRSKMDFVLYEGREKIAVDLSQSIQKILDSYKSGILVTSVTMQNVQPPEQVQAAFDDAVKAGQDRERLKNEGQAYANEVIPKARGMAERLLQEAEGYKAKVIAQSEGDASRFKLVQTEYAKAPQITRDRIYLDAMQHIFTNTTKVLVDVRQGNQLLYLPLDKLVAQTQSTDEKGRGNVTTGNASVPSSTVSNSNNGSSNDVSSSSIELRSRDGGLRSRDREQR